MEKSLTEEDRDRLVKNAAFKIASVLHGMTLCDALEAGDLAKRIILTTHKVDAENDVLMDFQREFEHAPSK